MAFKKKEQKRKLGTFPQSFAPFGEGYPFQEAVIEILPAPFLPHLLGLLFLLPRQLPNAPEMFILKNLT